MTTAKKKVLVVEDDSSIQLGLRINLESEGYHVLSAEDGELGLKLAESESPDLIILDVMLPKMNGFEVIQALRGAGHRMPIVVLSARTAEMDKVTGLELGAEDYVAKPFSLAELLARVKAHLRRIASEPRRRIELGDVLIDADARTVERANVSLDLTATEFDVMMCLVDAAGKALSRDEIFRRVWGPNHHGTPRTIDNFIQQLRTKLETDPQEPKLLLTVRGVGYRLAIG